MHIFMDHCYEYMSITGHTLAYYSDEVVETTHGRFRHFEKVHNFTCRNSMTWKTKRSRNRSSFILWNLTHRKFNQRNLKSKLRNRKFKRYFECEIPVENDPEDVISLLRKLTQKLQDERLSEDEIVAVLVELAQLEVTVPALLETGAGKVVRRLKDKEGRVARLAARLYLRWKRVVLKYEPPVQDVRMTISKKPPQPQQQQQEITNQRPQQQYYDLAPAQQQPGGQPRLQPQIRQWPTVRQPVQSGPVVVKTGHPRVEQPQKRIQVPQVISGQPGMPQQARPIVIRGQHPGGQEGQNYIIKSAGVFTSRPPPAVFQHALTMSRPPTADIMSRLQSLTPIRPNMTKLLKPAVQASVTDTYDASEIFEEVGQVDSSENLNYDASELLREFDYLQSSNVDILARALELSDSNNDVLSQAMELSGLNADTLMDL